VPRVLGYPPGLMCIEDGHVFGLLNSDSRIPDCVQMGDAVVLVKGARSVGLIAGGFTVDFEKLELHAEHSCISLASLR